MGEESPEVASHLSKAGPAPRKTRRFAIHALRVAAGVVVLAIITAVVSTRRPAPQPTRTLEARLELAAGEVLLKQGSETTTVASGVPLPNGAELSTAKGARALVRLSDGSAVFLRSESRLSLSPAGLALAAGEVWLDAPPSSRGDLAHALGKVTVPASNAGVSLRRVADDVTVYVARGLAVVASPGGRVEVAAGEQATVAGDGAPKVTAVKYWDDWTGGMADHRPLAGEGAGSGRSTGLIRSRRQAHPLGHWRSRGRW